MANHSPLILSTALLLLITAAHSLLNPSAIPSPAPSPTYVPLPTREDMDFIRTSCASTQHPQECFTSLSYYAGIIRQNPGRLTRIAIALSLYRARVQAAYFSNLSKEADYGADHRAAAALHDCFSVFGDAVDQLHGSLNQMRHLVGRPSETFQFQMSNIQTWMSAALTNEDTCTDGFDGVAEGPMKTEVFDRVRTTEAATSNALAFVNSYAAKASTDFVHFP